MQITAILSILMATVAIQASAIPSEIQARDICGPNYGADQRRTNSPCDASNGDRHFCGCDRTGIVECRNGVWTEVQDCNASSCHGIDQGAATC